MNNKDQFDDFKKIFENSKLNIDFEVQEFKNKIQNHIYSKEQIKFISDFMNIVIKSQFKEINDYIDYVDKDDIEILTILLDFVRYLKDLEIELNDLFGE